MLTVIVVTVAVAIVAGFVYIKREQLGLEGVGLALLRTVAVGALLLLLVNPGNARKQPVVDPVVLLDASLSMAAPGGMWEAAVDTARVLAGTGGRIFRFGSAVGPFDTERPREGSSRLSEALRSAMAIGGKVYVVTDGELDDAGVIGPDLLANVRVVNMPRDTVADVALLDVELPARARSDDSVRVTLTVGIWGYSHAPAATLEIVTGTRRLLNRQLDLPIAPGVARRRVWVPAGLLGNGTNVLHFRLRVPGDSVAEDNERIRIVDVTEGPSVVVLLDPPDWEGRFLVSELDEVSRTTVSAYARVTSNTWIDCNSATQIPSRTVQRNARAAALLVVRGNTGAANENNARQAVWTWPTFPDVESDAGFRDWYLSSIVPASPLAGRLAQIQWDSLPPLQALALGTSGARDWVAVNAQQGRRGAALPVLLGSDSSGTRSLRSVGLGWWRWRMRGGAAREAYRAILAAGVEWLLESGHPHNEMPLVMSTVVRQGEPLSARWVGGVAPDSVAIAFRAEGAEDEGVRYVRFGSGSSPLIDLEPGTYAWRTPYIEGVDGVVAVETYSDEYHPRDVAILGEEESEGGTLLERYARDNWWLFVIVVAALTVEWAWRHQRGLS